MNSNKNELYFQYLSACLRQYAIRYNRKYIFSRSELLAMSEIFPDEEKLFDTLENMSILEIIDKFGKHAANVNTAIETNTNRARQLLGEIALTSFINTLPPLLVAAHLPLRIGNPPATSAVQKIRPEFDIDSSRPCIIYLPQLIRVCEVASVKSIQL